MVRMNRKTAAAVPWVIKAGREKGLASVSQVLLINPFLLVWGGLSVMLLAFSFLPSLPYNVEELFTRWPRPVSSAVFGMALLVAFLPPVLLGWLLVKSPPGGLWRVPVGLAVHGLATYFGLRMAVPLESLHDLVGYPILDWPHELERALRFLALYGWFGLMAIGAAAFWVALRAYRLSIFRRWFVLALLLWPLAYWGVVEQAATDNLVELLRTGAGGGFGLFLSAWMFLVALGGSGVAARLAGYVSSTLAIVVLLLLTVGGGFVMANLATEPQVYKYGRTFPALSFLLSMDRDHYVEDAALLGRYVIAHVLLVAVIALAQFPAWTQLTRFRGRGGVAVRDAGLGTPSGSGRQSSLRQAREVSHQLPAGSGLSSEKMSAYALPGWWFWMALGYLVFVVYGSLVPLEFRPMDLELAWQQFQHVGYRRLGIGSRADWVANILLFIPLTFLWTGVFCRFAANRCGVKGVFIFGAAVLLSLVFEFTQQFFPPRTVSLNDIVAESVGAAIGVGLWWWKGKRVMGFLAGMRRIDSRASLAEYLLWIYLAAVFLYGVLPLDLTISPTEIYHKWKSGRVNLVPFAFPVGAPMDWIYGMATDILIWLPVGLLIVMVHGASVSRAWLFTVLLAALLEALQFFVYSRVTDVTDVIMAALGGGFGAWLGSRLSHNSGDTLAPSAMGRDLGCLLRVVAGFLVWVLLLMALFWYPFDFRMDRAFLRSHVGGFFKVPFHVYYYGTEYRAVTELLHKVLFFLPIGALLAAGWDCFKEGLGKLLYRVLGVLLAVFIPFVIELGQVALPGKHPDSTDLVLELLGIGAGFLLMARFRGILRRGGSSRSFRGARGAEKR